MLETLATEQIVTRVETRYISGDMRVMLTAVRFG